MKSAQLLFTPALLSAILTVTLEAEQAVQLRIDNDLQQVRVEARDAETDRWLAIASGYRDNADTGWLKVAIPTEYEGSELRVLGSNKLSALGRHIENARSASSLSVDYPPSVSNWSAEVTADSGGGRDAVVVEEADIWAWNGSTLYFYNQYRGLQVVDMSDPVNPEWLDYFRYPARGEDLYTLEDGTVILIGTGNYWLGESVALQMLSFNGSELSLEDTVNLEAGYYMDSRRYGDYLYVMTREWRAEINPRGDETQRPVIRLYSVSLLPGVEERVVDVQTFEANGWMDAVLTAQPEGILLSLNKWDNRTNSDLRHRWHSEVNVLVPGDDGVPQRIGVAPVAGIIQDKFKINFDGNLLTTISQQADWTTGQFSRATKLENFILDESGFVKTGSLDLAPGESLFATRFYGDTVYVVTFLFVDPLFSIDNSNPSNPVIAGELEVPGWSTYIEWVDDQLFAVGIEEARLTVSIFDVADPANMSLKDRVSLSEDSWAWSEALYDDQAISFFPDVRMLMLPFTTWSWKSSDQVQAMQLISWDDTGLQVRGAIPHLDTPRRGTLTGNTVVTVSGREVITTDISDPDLPIEGGKTTLAWNVSRLIALDEYLIQLETPDTYSGWYWYGRSSSATFDNPVAYVTSLKEPNIPAAEVPLASGRILGLTLQGNQLVLLQDVSEVTDTAYWEIPEKQDIAARAYDISNPLSPTLSSEVVLNATTYLGAAFDAHVRGDHVIWSSKTATNYYMVYADFWPGPYYAQRDLSYIVTEYNPATESVQIVTTDVFESGNDWGIASGWFWEDPVLLATRTDYTPYEKPEDGRTYYVEKSRLTAVDFSIAGEPLDLASPPVPQNLLGVEPGEDDSFYYFYFEPRYNVLEVWGWDGAIAVKLFDQEISRQTERTGSYSLTWMPPFNLRNRWTYDDNTSSNFLEVWIHDFEHDRFKRIQSFEYGNNWLSGQAVLEPYYLQSTSRTIDFFKSDADAGTFERLKSVELQMPAYYGMHLEETAIYPEMAFVPVGLYGVETLLFDEPLVTPEVTGFAQLSATNSWDLIESANWSLVDKSATDGAGSIQSYFWLYKPDSMRELDSEATDLGDLARESSWFGTYGHKATNPSWILHQEHGEMFYFMEAPANIDGVHFFHLDLGMVWTRADVYPWLYAFEDAEWVHYQPGSGLDGSQWFWGWKSGWKRGR